MNFNVPVILLKKLVILPNQTIKIELNNSISRQAIKEASTNYNGKILVVAPMDEFEEQPGVADLPKVGVIARIKSKLDIEDSFQVKLQGVKRVAVNKYFNLDSDVLYSDVMYIDLPSLIPSEENAILKKLIAALKKYISSASNSSNEILNYVLNNQDLNKITDAIASFLPLDLSKKLEYMQEINPLNRAKSLINDMEEEMYSIAVDNELDELIEDNLVNDQREYLLKEKLKVIKKELGEDSWKDTEVKEFRERLAKLNLKQNTKNHIEHEIEKYEIMNDASPEVSIMHNYLDLVINLPWNKKTKETTNFNKIMDDLNKSHYGLKEIKERITEYIAIKNLNKNIVSPIICLVGPPGVGKTSIAMSIAKALNRKFYKISVGGLNDSTELNGSRRTYIASAPGKIIQGINKCKSNNPVILIDEVDKMVKNYKGDPASTLLEILDPVQNKYFTDNYVEEPFDLSDVLFILTANYIDDIPLALKDRVETIELNSYTIFEKKDIAKNYILPSILEENMVDTKKIKFMDEILYFIIDKYTREAGVRELERILEKLARKIAINNIKTINEEKIIKLLGNPLYTDDFSCDDIIGVANTLAYTPVGGVVTKTEVVDSKGSGKITITGNVGDVMAESVSVALSMLKNKYKYNYNNTDIHIHFLEGATRKDGPSAGLSIACALASVFEKKTIPNNVAFTGEISLNGNILKIGGLKEKLIAAYNKNIKVVYMPKSNSDDLADIPDFIINNMELKLISNFSELYTNLFK